MELPVKIVLDANVPFFLTSISMADPVGAEPTLALTETMDLAPPVSLYNLEEAV